MNRKSADYYEFKDGWAPYWDDLLCGKLRIWEVPPEHRTLQAFTFAMRWARDTCPQKYSYTEKKLIEHFLLSDIIETHKTRDRRHGELYELYDQYYNPDGLNIFNSVGVDWEEYAACGFEQEEGSCRITYNMQRYKEETEKKRKTTLNSSPAPETGRGYFLPTRRSV